MLLDDCQKSWHAGSLLRLAVKHCVPGFNAESNENAIESMELAHEGWNASFKNSCENEF